MTGKRCSIMLLVLISVFLYGCKRDAEINASLAEVDSFTNEIVRRIDAAENPIAGADDAQQYLDSRKREIKAKAAFLAHVRGIQASEETQKKLIATVRSNQLTISTLQSQRKYSTLYMTDAAFKTKLDKLVNDYLELFTA